MALTQPAKASTVSINRGWFQPQEWTLLLILNLWQELDPPQFHTGVVLGKAQFMNLFRVRAMPLGDDGP